MKKLSLMLMFLFFVLSACNDDTAEIAPTAGEPVPVTQVTGPATATVGQAIAIEVTFRVKNECGKFDHFEEEANGAMRTITVHAVYVDKVCAQVITTLTETYTFTPIAAGTYTLRFWSGEDNQFITHTIVAE